MSQGVLGQADLVAATVTLMCVIDVTVQTINIRLCNRNAVPTVFAIAIGTGGTPTGKDWIQSGLSVGANGTDDDTGIVVSSGEKVWVSSSLANASCRVHGITVVP